MEPHGHSPLAYEERKEKEWKILKVAIVLTGTFMTLELVGGWISKSLALFSDGFHMFTDLLSYLLAFLALWYVKTKSPDSKRSFGYWRVEVLASFVNTIFLILVSGYIFYEGYLRFMSPIRPDEGIAIPVAVAGLAVNLLVFSLFKNIKHKSTNTKAVILHTIGDSLSSLGVIVGGIVIVFTNWTIIDPIVGSMIGVSILYWSSKLLIENLNVLMEGTPRDLKVKDVESSMRDFNEVLDVHDLHVWEITSNMYILTAHVKIKDVPLSTVDILREKMADKLLKDFKINHVNLQFECNSSCFVESA